jgi:ribosomal protein L40E
MPRQQLRIFTYPAIGSRQGASRQQKSSSSSCSCLQHELATQLACTGSPACTAAAATAAHAAHWLPLLELRWQLACQCDRSLTCMHSSQLCMAGAHRQQALSSSTATVALHGITSTFVHYVAAAPLSLHRVPPGWQPDAEQQAAVQEVKKSDGSARYCKKCNEHKPPRSHHCRVCERCVLRMVRAWACKHTVLMQPGYMMWLLARVLLVVSLDSSLN